MEPKSTWNNNPVIAHRGAWKKKNLPENSMAALIEAINLGCNGTEFDVQLTADGVAVVNHDPDFYGFLVETSTYEALLNKSHPNGEKIATLEAYLLQGMKQSRTKLILEIIVSEISKERSLLLADVCFNTVKKLKAEAWVEYISFDIDVLKYILTLNPEADLAYLNGDKTPEMLKRNNILGIDYSLDLYQTNENWSSEAKDQNIKLNVWTVNHAEDMLWLLDRGVNYITTDEPELLFELIRTRPHFL